MYGLWTKGEGVGAYTFSHFSHVFAGRRRNARSVGGYLALAGYNPTPAKRAKRDTKEEEEKKEEQNQMNGEDSETKVRIIRNHKIPSRCYNF